MNDFKEEWDEDPLDEYELAWVDKVIKKHYRFIGIRRYVGRDHDGQWYKSLHIQIYKWYDKEIIRWKIKEGLWD